MRDKNVLKDMSLNEKIHKLASVMKVASSAQKIAGILQDDITTELMQSFVKEKEDE